MDITAKVTEIKTEGKAATFTATITERRYSIEEVNSTIDKLVASAGAGEVLDSLIQALDTDTRNAVLLHLETLYNV